MTDAKGKRGGTRPGAGRPRTKTLDAVEAGFLAGLLQEQPYAEEFADLISKLRHIAEREEEKDQKIQQKSLHF